MSQIKVGDLVMVARPTPCCGNENQLGLIFVARRARIGWCRFCGAEARGFLKPNGFGCDERRLKKIPPLSELEGEQRKEELTA